MNSDRNLLTEVNDLDIILVAEKLGLQPKKIGSKYYTQCLSCSSVNKCSLFKGSRGQMIYHCFKCNNTGGVFGLIKTCLPDVKPTEWCADNGLIPPFDKRDNQYKNKKAEFKKLVRDVTPEFDYIRVDRTEMLESFLSYLSDVDEDHYLVKERGLDVSVLNDNKVKAVTLDGIDKFTSLYKQDQLISLGLMNTNGYFLFEHCNAVFPFCVKGKPVYLQGRVDKKKYPDFKSNYVFQCSVPDSQLPSLYIPNHPIFNTDIYVVEGVITALTIASLGESAIALSSSSKKLTDEDFQQLDVYKDQSFILMPDNDTGVGVKAMLRLETQLKNRGFKVNEGFSQGELLTSTDIASQHDTIDEKNIDKMTDINNILQYLLQQEAL